MTHKQTDVMGEVLFWIKQVSRLALGVSVMLYTNPAVRQTLIGTCEKAKMKIKKLF